MSQTEPSTTVAPNRNHSGLSSGAAEWTLKHYDELAPLLAVDEPFRFDDIATEFGDGPGILDMDIRRAASAKGVLQKVERKRVRGNVFHTWELVPGAKQLLEDYEREDSLPCGHRISWENVEEGYRCKVCGEIHSREAVEAVL